MSRGKRVRHPRYGYGVILSEEGSGEETRLTVYFDRAGKKKFVARYAGLNEGMTDLRNRAQLGLQELKEAILGVLREEPEGLSNAEIVKRLALESEFEGRNRNYLSWSVLGILLRERKVRYSCSRLNRRYFILGS